MVDAAIGGKTAIDLDGAKNIVGTFSLPKAIFAAPSFLDTLPEREWLSGFAELFKHALIADVKLWDYLEKTGMSGLVLNPERIEQASRIKEATVKSDFKESGQRKTLNYGHTLGHAIESLSMQIDEIPISHGHAIAIGMILANRIAVNKQLLSRSVSERINTFIYRYYEQPDWLKTRSVELLDYAQKDKKNKGGKIRMVLISDIGKALIDIEVAESEIVEVLSFV